MVRLAQKAFAPGAAAVPAPARRHDVEVPGDDRVPRSLREGQRARPPRPHEPAAARRGHQPVRVGQQQVHAGHEDARAARGAPRGRLRRGVRRRAARRGAVAREGARLSFRDRVRPVGPEEPAARAVEPLQRQDHARARASAPSRSRTGPSSTSGSTSGSRRSRSCRSTSRRARPVVERDGTLIMVDDERMRLAPGEEPRVESVRFRTLGCYPLTGAVRSDGDDAARDHPRDARGDAAPSARAASSITTRRRRWRRRSARATSEHGSSRDHGQHRARRARRVAPRPREEGPRCASSRSARSTTASRR